ncbi:cell surface mannoprotein [Acrasis kona]|uniref:Cell surface mannoprotein n=1 Tax=Acrasis kona TaxID=1008807 RepID=A0AAW2ZEK4_9EUKA
MTPTAHLLLVIISVGLLLEVAVCTEVEVLVKDNGGKIPTDCWACPAGQIHWWEAGWPSSADRCACTPGSPCWTCPAGFVHWWEAGWESSGGDRCNCVKKGPGPGPSPPAPPAPPSLRALQDAFTPSGGSPGCIAFGPYVRGFGPGAHVPDDLVNRLLDIMIRDTGFRCIQLYGLDARIAKIAKSKGIKVHGIVWLNLGDNTAAINSAIAAVQQVGTDTILGVSCGSELFVRNQGQQAYVEQTIRACIRGIRDAVKVPVGINDASPSWFNQYWRMADEVDYIGVNLYPFFDNYFGGCSHANEAGLKTINLYRQAKNKYSGKLVLITEAGWPGNNHGARGCAATSDNDQRLAMQQIVDEFRRERAPVVIFELFREPWKGEGNGEDSFGVCVGDAPYNCVTAPR